MTPPPGAAPHPSDRGCPVCGAPLELAWAAAEAEVGRARVRVDRAPHLACSDDRDHPRHDPTDPATGATLATRAASAAGAQLTVARRPRLPWRPARCAACATELTMPGFRSERAVTVTGGGTPAYTLALDLPLWRCPDCAVENVPREAWEDAEEAIGGALARATGG